MDQRIPLKLHTTITLEGMDCLVEEVVGQGSNAIVYKCWYEDRLNPELRHYALVKELFPYHSQGKIRRMPDNSLLVEPDAREHWEDHKKSFLAGNEVHLRLLKDNPDMVGGNLNSFCANGTLYSLLGYSGGRSLQSELNASGNDLRRYVRWMQRLLDALEAFHKSGYLHLDISPDNIMLVGSGENERIFLIDFNSVHELGAQNCEYLSSKPGYSAPEVSLGDCDRIGMPSDLYSVAAVFYRCLMGRTMTLEESLRASAPEGKDSACLNAMPETVVSMVSRIMKKGLHILPAKRYQSIGQMRLAFAELLDRIDGVGVTHWSLWENGKRSVEELIRTSPALKYIKDEERLYPIRVKGTASNQLRQYVEETLLPEGTSSLVVARGGMGKTTLLLHTALFYGKHYSPNSPAVFYVSLAGWNGKDSQYIQNQILMRLRFRKEMNHYDSAGHALRQLLERPLNTRNGSVPVVLLLLDGLNEVHGDPGVLIREINELNRMAGVRVLATSRNVLPELEMQTAELIPLEVEDIEAALGRNGLLIPQKQEVLQLLRTPLILSAYIQASEAGKQLDIDTEAELMQAYMKSLLEKEWKLLPENSPKRWQTDAALNYVLPAVAAKARKKGGALTERQVLKVVAKCRRTLKSPLMKRAFPKWIGHTKDIFAETKTAEQWYGSIIHHILYRHLGLLIRDDSGRYRVFHQSVEDYLASSFVDVAAGIQKKIRKACAIAAAGILVLCAIAALYAAQQLYLDDLEDSVDMAAGICDGLQEDIDKDFPAVISDAYAYIRNPTALNAKTMHEAVYAALLDIQKHEKYMLYDEESPWFDPELGRMQYSAMEEQYLASIGQPVDNLRFVEKNYLAAEVFPVERAPFYYDYYALLFTLEALVAHHQETGEDIAQLELYLTCMEEFLFQRDELNWKLDHAYRFDDPNLLPDVAELDAELEALAEQILRIYQAMPQQVRDENEEHISEFIDTQRHISYGYNCALPEIPTAWPKPDWLPENAKGTYLAVDIDGVGFAEITEIENAFPFVWYVTCYNIPEEDMLDYRETLMKQCNGYRTNDDTTTKSVVIELDDVFVTITWTAQKTVITVTGDVT